MLTGSVTHRNVVALAFLLFAFASAQPQGSSLADDLVLQQIHEPSAQIRTAALKQLQQRISPSSIDRPSADLPGPVREAVVAALGDTDEFVRTAAAAVLGVLGPHASTAQVELTAHLSDRSLLVRLAVLGALARVAIPDSIVRAAVIPLLDDADGSVRSA